MARSQSINNVDVCLHTTAVCIVQKYLGNVQIKQTQPIGTRYKGPCS